MNIKLQLVYKLKCLFWYHDGVVILMLPWKHKQGGKINNIMHVKVIIEKKLSCLSSQDFKCVTLLLLFYQYITQKKTAVINKNKTITCSLVNKKKL